MRQVSRIRTPILERDGVLFHITTLSDVIPGGPQGIFIDEEYAKTSPVLKRKHYPEFNFTFIAINPRLGIPEGAPVLALMNITGQVLSNKSGIGRAVPIDLYAEWTNNTDSVRDLLEATIDSGLDSPEVKSIADQLLEYGFESSIELINILRRQFLQYWLLPPVSSGWSNVLYFSKARNSWYALDASENFKPSLMSRYETENTKVVWEPNIILKAITVEDEQNILEQDVAQEQYSFAEEIIATSLVELAENRLRSAILHAIIGLEAAVQKSLNSLITKRLAGMEQGNVLNTISKELSVITLARIVYYHVCGEEKVDSIKWELLQSLYDTRNTIVHRGRRKMPSYEVLKTQIIEVFDYIQDIEASLRS